MMLSQGADETAPFKGVFSPKAILLIDDDCLDRPGGNIGQEANKCLSLLCLVSRILPLTVFLPFVDRQPQAIGAGRDTLSLPGRILLIG
jgi:hypothetical protein